MKPQIIFPDSGIHNRDLPASSSRIIRGSTYKEISTICIVPTRGILFPRVVQSWFGLLLPMNQKFLRIFMTGMEVGEAYSQAIDTILANPELNKWKYVLTLEDDNIPPPDGLLKLLESIKGYDAVGGLYWTKGEGGQPMVYGDPAVMPRNFIPQIPQQDILQPCNGLGMGFTLFKLDMFKDQAIPRPLFKTVSDFIPYQGTRVYTQDLYFFENALNLGYKFACDTRVKVGHYDPQTDMIW